MAAEVQIKAEYVCMSPSNLSDSALNIAYIVLPTIPLLLLLLVASGVFCFKLLAKRYESPTFHCVMGM